MTQFLASNSSPAGMSSDQVVSYVLSCLEEIGHSLEQIAEAIRYADRVGLDISPLTRGGHGALVARLRRVNEGRILLALAEKHVANPSAYKLVAKMELGDQRRYVEGEKVKMVVYADNLQDRSHKLRDVFELSPSDLTQVFELDAWGKPRLRSTEEQGKYLDAKNSQTAILIKQKISRDIMVDEDTGIITFRGAVIPPYDLERAVRAYRAIIAKKQRA